MLSVDNKLGQREFWILPILRVQWTSSPKVARFIDVYLCIENNIFKILYWHWRIVQISAKAKFCRILPRSFAQKLFFFKNASATSRALFSDSNVRQDFEVRKETTSVWKVCDSLSFQSLKNLFFFSAPIDLQNSINPNAALWLDLIQDTRLFEKNLNETELNWTKLNFCNIAGPLLLSHY